MKRAFVRWMDVKSGDAFSKVIFIKGYDLEGKNVAMNFVKDFGRPAAVRFTTEDGSITTSYDAVNERWRLAFSKTSLQMKNLDGLYKLDIEAYTTTTDTETFADGVVYFVGEITKRDKPFTADPAAPTITYLPPLLYDGVLYGIRDGQYAPIDSSEVLPQYRYYSDGTVIYREGVRGGILVSDRTLSPTGFAGIENTDWENLATLP